MDEPDPLNALETMCSVFADALLTIRRLAPGAGTDIWQEAFDRRAAIVARALAAKETSDG